MKRLIHLIILLSFLNCKKENYKSDFIGNWSSISNSVDDLDIQFFNDSIVYHYYSNKHSTSWTVLGNKIEQTLLSNLYANGKDVRSTLEFSFSSRKDTLFLNLKKDSTISLIFRKTYNAYDYFENKIGLRIKLPLTNKKSILVEKFNYDFNIYVGKKNNKIIAKTNNSNNLNQLHTEVFSLFTKISEKDSKKVKYKLFIDKNISTERTDSIKAILKKGLIEKLFIVTGYKEKEWNGPIKWIGYFE